MANLLTIPLEIRDAIIELVLLSGRPAPVDHHAAGPTRAPVVDVRFNSWLRPGKAGIMYEPESPVPAATPLLLANRQLRNETEKSLERIPGQGRNYTLDLMMIEERELWPTWTHVPAYTQHLDSIDVTVRIVGSLGSASPETISMNTFLEQTFKAGLVGQPFLSELRTQRSLDQPSGHEIANLGLVHPKLTVKHLNINFVSPDDITQVADPASKGDWLRARDYLPTRRNRSLMEHSPLARQHKKIMRSEWLAAFLVNRVLKRLLSMHRDSAKYGAILYERIGDITVKVDGEILEELRIPDQFATLKFNRSILGKRNDPDREPTFDRWKEQTIRDREQAGMLIKPFVEEPLNERG